MGVHIHIYDMDAREYIDCGKKLSGGFGFQLPSERIMKFILERATHSELRIFPDTGPLPSDNDEETWTEVDTF